MATVSRVSEMNFEKATKTTYVYVDADPTNICKVLYIHKAMMPKQAPEKIKVVVEWEE